MNVTVFNNANLQQQLDSDGYVIVPFLSATEIEQLKALYNNVTQHPPPAFHSTSFNTNYYLKQQITAEVESIYADKVNNMFGNIQKLGTSFLTKPVGITGTMPVHQDWTIVDETKSYSVTIWVPLQDVDAENGAMKVLPGSHRFSKTLRSPNVPNEFENVAQLIDSKMKLLPMKAGEAFIFNHALLHSSTLNQSTSARIAVTYGLIPAGTELCMYIKNYQSGKMERYSMPLDMFSRYCNVGSVPDCGTKTDEFDYEVKPVTPFQLEQMIARNKPFKLKPLFKDPAHQEFFEKEGYLLLPLLNETEVKELKEFYHSLHIKDQYGFGFHVSMDQPDKGMSLRVREKIWSVILPKLSKYLLDFKPFVASFVVKEPNPKGLVQPHQDWSFTDNEDEGYCSVTCWTSLVHANIDNGGMGVIRGSNKLINFHRPSPFPHTPVALEKHLFSIFPYVKTIDTKPGDVLMFDNRTFHASPPNTSDEVRLAAGVGITQQDAQLVHFSLKPDGKKNAVIKYKVDEDFFLRYNNAALRNMYEAGQLIQGYEVLGETPYIFPEFSSEEIIDFIKDAGNEINMPLCEKLATLFNYNIDGSQQQPKTEQQPVMVTEPTPEPIKEEWKWVDNRTFFEKYTPLNIAREIKNRLIGN